jgi:hypothetical protein
MDSLELFRDYAKECMRLAVAMPEHRQILQDMAEAWVRCAERVQKNSPGAAERLGC